MCAAEDWNEDELFETVRRAYPYRSLPRTDFDEIVQMLSEGIAGGRGRYAAVSLALRPLAVMTRVGDLPISRLVSGKKIQRP